MPIVFERAFIKASGKGGSLGGKIAYVSHFQMFSYIFTFGIDAREIHIVCAGIIDIKI